MKKLCCKHYKVIEVPWGATPPWSPLFFYPTWPRCGFSACLLGFLLDIGHFLGLCPLKIRGPSQAKWTKASSVLIWRTMAEFIHDSRPSIWTSPHNLLRSQISLSFFSIVFCIFFKETKNNNSCLSLLIRFVKSPSMAKSPSTAQNRLSWQTKQNRLSRHLKILSLSLNICAVESYKKSLISFLLVKVNLRIIISNFK